MKVSMEDYLDISTVGAKQQNDILVISTVELYKCTYGINTM